MVVQDSVEKCDIHSYHYYGKLQVQRCLRTCCAGIWVSAGIALCTEPW